MRPTGRKDALCFKTLLLGFVCTLYFGADIYAIDFPPRGKSHLRVVALGDSVVWGQGLNVRDKFCSVVSEMLAACAGVQVELTFLAHSGAVIGVNLPVSLPVSNPEVPNSYPTILAQCANFNDSPDTVDLVILDGGANDVGILSVINPNKTPDEIATSVRQFCYYDLLTVLRRVSVKFSNAKIIITGYYPGISEYSDLDAVKAVLVGANLAGGSIIGELVVLFGFDEIREKVISNCRRFNDEARVHIQTAVNDVNKEAIIRGERVRASFADPSFGPENALFTPSSWLFGLRTSVLPPVDFLDPVDSQAALRRSLCVVTDCNVENIDCMLEKLKCRSASFGHPTERGARAYASAIGAALGFAWVDFSGTRGGNERMEFPFQTLARAVEHVPSGGTVLMNESVTAETIRISKACKLEACGGSVTIGKAN